MRRALGLTGRPGCTSWVNLSGEWLAEHSLGQPVHPPGILPACTRHGTLDP